MKNNKGFYIVIVIVLSIGLLFYLLSLYVSREPFRPVGDIYKEVSFIHTFPVPGGEDVVEHTISLDENGLIVDVMAHGVLEPSLDVKLGEFTEKLLPMIKGKKLSDLEEIDTVGTSTLTTESFNASLDELKSQI